MKKLKLSVETGQVQTMANNSPAHQGIYTAGNNHYHGVKSINEYGALAHANKLAKILLREGKVASEVEALSISNFEVQRLRWNCEGFQGNRMAREELRREQLLQHQSLLPSFP